MIQTNKPQGKASHNTIKYKMMNKAIQGYFKIDDQAYLGAPAVSKRRSYYMDIFEEMGTKESAHRMFNSIFKFLRKPALGFEYPHAYFAVFDETEVEDQQHFDALVWTQLYPMHQKIMKLEPHEDLVYDPNDPDFILILGGKTVNITGLHPKSNRKSRRFPWPVLVFSVNE